MKIEDIKIGAKIKISDRYPDLSPEGNKLKKANAIFEVVKFYPNFTFQIKLLDWDKQFDIIFVCGAKFSYWNNEMDFFDEVNCKIEDHSGMIYNHYNDNWSYL